MVFKNMNSNKKLLITTALEETWAMKSKYDRVFLGEWCKEFNRKNIWSKFLFSTLKDPWSDRKKRKQKYLDIDTFYEQKLLVIAKALNKFHNIDKPLIYWRILVGPWLKLFINSTNHHWDLINGLKKSNWKGRTISIRHNDLIQISFDMEHFYRLRLSDIWNHHICSIIYNMIFGEKSIDYIDYNLELNKKIENFKYSDYKYSNTNVSKWFRKIINKISTIINRDSSFFFFNTYLNSSLQLKMYSKLLTIPTTSISPFLLNIEHYSKEIREDLSCDLINPKDSSYEQFFIENIFKYLPINYLEGYKDAYRYMESKNWPKSPQAIVTANAHWGNDTFKFYAAEKVNKGSKLKLIVHGGHGKSEYSDFEKHEIDICENIFSWGWEKHSTKIKKGFYIKKKVKRVRRNIKDYLLHVMLSEWKYHTFIKSCPSYEQFINHYINDQYLFLANLNSNICNSTLIKPQNKFNFHEEILSSHFKDLKFIYNSKSFNELISKAKIVVHTYNETTIVETLANNIPTIAFWNPEQWEPCSSSTQTQIYTKLISCGIVHECPISASKHLNEIWEDIDDWWQSKEVRIAVLEHNRFYARTTNNQLTEILDFIKN